MDASLSLKTTKWTKFAWNKVRMGELGVSSLKCSRRSCVGLDCVKIMDSDQDVDVEDLLNPRHVSQG